MDKSVYTGNHFEDINGKCMDLDGFHDGEIRGNSCISQRSYDDYPNAQYGIVFDNSNPDMQSVNVTIIDNLIDGTGYGGIFLIGSGHVVSGNRLLGLNRDRCTGDMRQARCNDAPDQPALLHSGIYLGSGAARPAHTVNNRIQGNQISGFAIAQYLRGCGAGRVASGEPYRGESLSRHREVAHARVRTQHRACTHPAERLNRYMCLITSKASP